MRYYNIDSNELLTNRELEVLKCVNDGLTNPQISRKLCITISTVKAHISSLLKKLIAKNRVEILLMLVGKKDIKNIKIRNQINSIL